MPTNLLENSVHPLSVEAYHFLYENGLIQENVELIEGVIYKKMPKNPLHSEVLRRLFDFIRSKVEYPVFKEDPLTLEDSEPEPDIAILPHGDYSRSHPNFALVVIELASTSLALDRKKANVYSKGNIPEYVLVNLVENKLEIYKRPQEGIYTEIRILSKDEVFVSNSVPGLQFSLGEFM